MSTTLPLPAALQGWASWLSWFTPELATEIGPLLIRLHPLLGRFKGQRQGGPEEPDGVGDLRRKGSYERLLASEWLLATEVPDEFLRRAASSEHLFLAPRLRARSADKLVVAIFDTGPWQLGSPRLAQMALWILLARRAVEAGGELRWGSWQRPGQWRTAVSPEHLKQFLAARCVEVAKAEHVVAWSDWLAGHAEGLGECWWIGHDLELARRVATTASTHTVRLRRSLEGDSLDVRLKAGAALRAMQLPLPAPEAGAPLLKGRFQGEAPLDAHQAPSFKLSLRFDPVFDLRGHRVGVQLLDEPGVMVFDVAPTSRSNRGQPKRQNWARGSKPLATAFSGHVIGAVLGLPAQLNFWQRPELGLQLRPPKEHFDAAPGRGTLLPMVWSVDEGRHRAFVVDASGRLVCWSAPDPKIKPRGEVQGPELVDKDVLAIAAVSETLLVYACRDVGCVWIRFAGTGAKGQHGHSRNLLSDPGPSAKVFLSGGDRWQHGFGACAVRLAADDQTEGWRVAQAPTSSQPDPDGWEVRLAPGARAVGLVKPRSEDGYALVVLSADQCAFTMQSPARAAPIYRSASVVERVVVCPNTGLIAMLTRDGQMQVYSTHDQAMRYAAHPTGDAAAERQVE